MDPIELLSRIIREYDSRGLTNTKRGERFWRYLVEEFFQVLPPDDPRGKEFKETPRERRVRERREQQYRDEREDQGLPK